MTSQQKERATIGGGCFWCIESVFDKLTGVEDVASGYAGGHKPNPTYAEVCGEKTGHAEVVQITFDPKVISYKELLEIFFTVHDPTTLNRQGNDAGTSYRSVILPDGAAQEATAKEVIKEVTEKALWGKKPIVTDVKPLDKFWRAEEYHQHFYENNPDQMYCRITIEPKLSKLRQYFLGKLKK